MKFLLWKIRYMYWFRKRTCYDWRISWQAANACSAEEFEIDEYTPSESVDMELSYWTD